MIDSVLAAIFRESLVLTFAAMKKTGLPPAILLMGPTASGKTAIAMALADSFPVELISVDSAQVFCEMNIGTAKPDAETLARYPHHLIDLIPPTEHYSAARFRNEALAVMADITRRGKIPLLVGGTLLYFRTLLEGIADLPEADPALRAQLDAEAAQIGWPGLHAKLALLDPSTAQRLHSEDGQRIQRALEVCLLSGRPMSALLAESSHTPTPAYDFLRLGLLPSARQVLHERIAQRFDAMLTAGLEDEVYSLRQRYALHPDLPSMRCVGYRQVWEAQEGVIPARELRDRGIFATRQLAKRQITWLTNSIASETFDCLDPGLSTRIHTRVAEYLEQESGFQQRL